MRVSRGKDKKTGNTAGFDAENGRDEAPARVKDN